MNFVGYLDWYQWILFIALILVVAIGCRYECLIPPPEKEEEIE